MKFTHQDRTQGKGKNKPACVFCAAGYHVPVLRMPAKLYGWTGKHFGDDSIPVCWYHAKLYTDWLPPDPEERRKRRAEMNAIIQGYFKRRNSR